MKKDTDFNYVSFFEDGKCSDPNQLIQRVEVDGKFVHWQVMGQVFLPEEPELYDDILKLSHARDYFFFGCKFLGMGLNKEDGIDLNRDCHDNYFGNCVIECGRNIAITCKGGSSGNHWADCRIRGRGKIVEVEFANHSDQSKAKCIDNTLENMTHEDGKPVRVAWGYRAERPKIIGGNVKICWWWTGVLHLYTFAKEHLPFIP